METSLFKKERARTTPANPRVTALAKVSWLVSTALVVVNQSNNGTTGSVMIKISPAGVSMPSKQRTTLGCFMVLASFRAFCADAVVLPLRLVDLGLYLKMETGDLSAFEVPAWRDHPWMSVYEETGSPRW